MRALSDIFLLPSLRGGGSQIIEGRNRKSFFTTPLVSLVFKAG
jgi:hypothetical protein